MTPRTLAALISMALPACAGAVSTVSGPPVRPPTPAFAPVLDALRSGDLSNVASVDPAILAPYVGDVAAMAREPGHYGGSDAAEAWSEALPRSLLAGLAGSRVLPEAETQPPTVTSRRAATEYVMALASSEGALDAYLAAHRGNRAPEGPAREALADLETLASVLRGLDPAQRAAFVAKLDRAREAGARFQAEKDPAVLEEFWNAHIRKTGAKIEPAPASPDVAAELVRAYLDPAHLDGHPSDPALGRWVEDAGYRELHQANVEVFFPGGRPHPLGELVDVPTQLAWFKVLREAAPELLAHTVRSALLAGRLFVEVNGSRSEHEAFRLVQKMVLHDVGKLEILEHERAEGDLTPDRRRTLMSHAVRGERLILEALLAVPGLDRRFWLDAAEIALTHHERVNGKGYPAALPGEELGTKIRLAAFSDVVDAMVGWRHYQRRHSVEEALRALYERHREEHDPTGWDVFLRVFSKAEEAVSRAFREVLETWRKTREADLVARARPFFEGMRTATGAPEGAIKPKHMGSLSNVYEVREPLTGRPVAVKVPSSPDAAPTVEMQARLFQLAHEALAGAPGGRVAGFRVPEPIIITDEIRAQLRGVDLTQAAAYEYVEGEPLPDHGPMTPEQYRVFRAGLRILNQHGIFFYDVGVPWGANIQAVGQDMVIIDGLMVVPQESPEFTAADRAKRAKSLFENQEAVLDTVRSLFDLLPPDPPGADYAP